MLGTKFKIVTDSEAFSKIIAKQDLETRILRWAMLLQDYDFEIEHRSASLMRHVDELSRNIVVVIKEVDDVVYRVKTAQNKDSGLRATKDILKEKPYDDYCVRNGLLYKNYNNREFLVVSDGIQAEIVRNAHDKGHFALRKTMELINREFFIPQNIKMHCKLFTLHFK